MKREMENLNLKKSVHSLNASHDNSEILERLTEEQMCSILFAIMDKLVYYWIKYPTIEKLLGFLFDKKELAGNNRQQEQQKKKRLSGEEEMTSEFTSLSLPISELLNKNDVSKKSIIDAISKWKAPKVLFGYLNSKESEKKRKEAVEDFFSDPDICLAFTTSFIRNGPFNLFFRNVQDTKFFSFLVSNKLKTRTLCLSPISKRNKLKGRVKEVEASFVEEQERKAREIIISWVRETVESDEKERIKRTKALFNDCLINILAHNPKNFLTHFKKIISFEEIIGRNKQTRKWSDWIKDRKTLPTLSGYEFPLLDKVNKLMITNADKNFIQQRIVGPTSTMINFREKRHRPITPSPLTKRGITNTSRTKRMRFDVSDTNLRKTSTPNFITTPLSETTKDIKLEKKLEQIQQELKKAEQELKKTYEDKKVLTWANNDLLKKIGGRIGKNYELSAEIQEKRETLKDYSSLAFDFIDDKKGQRKVNNKSTLSFWTLASIVTLLPLIIIGIILLFYNMVNSYALKFLLLFFCFRTTMQSEK